MDDKSTEILDISEKLLELIAVEVKHKKCICQKRAEREEEARRILLEIILDMKEQAEQSLVELRESELHLNALEMEGFLRATQMILERASELEES